MCQYSSDNGHATDWHFVHVGVGLPIRRAVHMLTFSRRHWLLADQVLSPWRLRLSLQKAEFHLRMLYVNNAYTRLTSADSPHYRVCGRIPRLLPCNALLNLHMRTKQSLGFNSVTLEGRHPLLRHGFIQTLPRVRIPNPG